MLATRPIHAIHRHVGSQQGPASVIASQPCRGCVGPSSSRSSSRHPGARVVIARNGLGDDLLDFIEAGRKMRKWYGQGERGARPPGETGKDSEPEDEDEMEGDGDIVLVTDAEGAVGEQVVLQLILARANIRVLVKDVAATKLSYGSYVDPVSVDLGNAAAVKSALRGVGSVVVVGKLGALPQVLPASGVSHVLLLSTVGTGGQGGLLGMFQGVEAGVLADPSREAQIQKCGVAHSIVRSPPIKQSPGGQANLVLSQQEGAAAKGAPISCEDLAAVMVATLRRPPASSRTFQVMNAGPGTPPGEWTPLFQQLKETALA